ncbi:hypothetical protein CBR_g46183 [Chara braunii]|uniref:Uncharacterized protein n=1 Tax=Chara braunii TaxID=69332 RepID=A0A388M075_CHABU|nr:hypothetical protein CBR_g46183 [Chara braunii]|eukprot:GBG87883.1 hypothetical protein CBR_g46183 [Chara braunii]
MESPRREAEKATNPPTIDSGASRPAVSHIIARGCEGLWSLRERVLGWFDPEGTAKPEEGTRTGKEEQGFGTPDGTGGTEGGLKKMVSYLTQVLNKNQGYLADAKKKLTFDGANITKFLIDYENLAALLRWSEEEKMEHLGQHVSLNLGRDIMAIVATSGSWKEARDVMMQKYLAAEKIATETRLAAVQRKNFATYNDFLREFNLVALRIPGVTGPITSKYFLKQFTEFDKDKILSAYQQTTKFMNIQDVDFSTVTDIAEKMVVTDSLTLLKEGEVIDLTGKTDDKKKRRQEDDALGVMVVEKETEVELGANLPIPKEAREEEIGITLEVPDILHLIKAIRYHKFDYKIERIDGLKNRADGLSRVCFTPEGVEDVEPTDAFLDYEGGTLAVENEMIEPACTSGELLIKTLEKGSPAVVAVLREGAVTRTGHKEELMAMVVQGGREVVMSLVESWEQKRQYLVNQVRNGQEDRQDQKEFFLIRSYDDIFKEIDLLLVGNKKVQEVILKAREEVDKYVLRNEHLFRKEEGLMPRRKAQDKMELNNENDVNRANVAFEDEWQTTERSRDRQRPVLFIGLRPRRTLGRRKRKILASKPSPLKEGEKLQPLSEEEREEQGVTVSKALGCLERDQAGRNRAAEEKGRRGKGATGPLV